MKREHRLVHGVVLATVVSVAFVGLSGCALFRKPKPRPPRSPNEHLAVIGMADPQWGPAPLKVHFSESTFERNDITEFHWDFGDGSSSTDKDPTHTYTKPGDYNVTVKVTSPSGMTDIDFIDITVYPPGQN